MKKIATIFSAILFFLWMSGVAFSAVSVGNTTTISTGGNKASSITVSHNAAGSNFLYVLFALNDPGAPNSFELDSATATFNGVPMVVDPGVDRIQNPAGGTEWSYGFSLSNPDQVTGNIVISWVGTIGSTTDLTGGALSFTGVTALGTSLSTVEPSPTMAFTTDTCTIDAGDLLLAYLTSGDSDSVITWTSPAIGKTATSSGLELHLASAVSTSSPVDGTDSVSSNKTHGCIPLMGEPLQNAIFGSTLYGATIY